MQCPHLAYSFILIFFTLGSDFREWLSRHKFASQFGEAEMSALCQGMLDLRYLVGTPMNSCQQFRQDDCYYRAASSEELAELSDQRAFKEELHAMVMNMHSSRLINLSLIHI